MYDDQEKSKGRENSFFSSCCLLDRRTRLVGPFNSRDKLERGKSHEDGARGRPAGR